MLAPENYCFCINNSLFVCLFTACKNAAQCTFNFIHVRSDAASLETHQILDGEEKER